jgi:hypothetical protein
MGLASDYLNTSSELPCPHLNKIWAVKIRNTEKKTLKTEPIQCIPIIVVGNQQDDFLNNCKQQW